MADRLRFVGAMDRVLYLRTLSELDGVPPAELGALAEHGRERVFRPGEVLLEEGRPPESFFVLAQGEVEASRGGVVLARLGEREPVGLLTLLSGEERGIRAVARGDVLCLEFEAEILQDALEENFAIVQNLLRNAARRYLRLFRRVGSGAFLGDWPEEVSCPVRGLDLVERMILLRKAHAFSDAGLDSLAELARQMEEERIEPGQTLFRAGEVGRRIRIVVCGRVACTEPGTGRSFVAGAGFPLGSIEAYAGERRWHDAVALDGVVTLSTSVEVLVDLMEDHLDMALSFLAAISSRILHLGESLARDPDPDS